MNLQQKIASITDTVDVLVNNAGMMDGRWQSFEDVDMEQSLEVLNVNTIPSNEGNSIIVANHEINSKF